MPGFVNRDIFRIWHITRGQPAGSSGEERGVFHATCSALPGWIDHGHVVVRIRAEPFPKYFKVVRVAATCRTA